MDPAARPSWDRWLRPVLLAVGLYDVLYLGVWLSRGERPRFGDFFALWSFGDFLHTAPAAAIYDPLALQTFQQTLEPAFTAAYPFLYPPSFLLVVAPLALLPVGVSWLAWCAGTMVLYVLAVLGRSWRSRAAWVLLVAPTSLLCVVSGQSGLLTAGLMLGGLRALPRRPWLAGVLFGLLTVKPQLGLLVPVALLSARQWRAIAGAALTAAAVVLATGLAFGWDIFAAWADSLPRTVDLVLRNRSEVARIAPTVGAGLYQLGVPDGPARLVQVAVALVAAAATWRAFRPGVDPAAMAVLVIATFLATPYAYIYDLPMVTGALVLVSLTRRPDRIVACLFALIVGVPFVMLRTPLPLVMPLLFAAALVVLDTVRQKP